MEKYQEDHIEDKGVSTPSEQIENFSDAYSLEHSEVNEKAVIRKTDYRLVPWLSLLYLLSFLDRTNIGNANLFGLSKALHLSPGQYALCLSLFFLFYVLFEVPSNMTMKAWRPSMWLPIIMVAWGGVMIGMGFVKDFKSLLVARIFLGITEAGLFPGVSYYMTLWYRRYEINFRIAMFFSAATAAGAFGGLLARLINEMDGVSGYEGWRWIFILEGLLTVVVALASFFMLHDYPQTAKFLSPAEKAFMKHRLSLDSDGLSSDFKNKFILQAFMDWKIWAFAFMFHFALMPVYSFSLFAPTLTANLGYTAARAQLMSVPPYVLAAITTVSLGYLSDKMQRRGLIVMASASVATLGWTLLICTKLPGVQYTGMFLAAAGGYPLIPLVVSWGQNNVGGSLKRGVAAAIIVSIGNLGGCISAYTYPKPTAPRYFRGHGLNLAYNVLCVVLAVVMTVYLKRANAKKDAINAQRGSEWTHQEKAPHAEEGDDAPFFRYTL